MKYELIFTRNGCDFSISAEPRDPDANIEILAQALADIFGAAYMGKEEKPGGDRIAEVLGLLVDAGWAGAGGAGFDEIKALEKAKVLVDAMKGA